MILTYTAEGAGPREWQFKPKRLLNAEAEEIERRTSMTFEEWAGALQKGSMLAFHALLFVLLKREQPRLAWDQVKFCGEDVDLAYELDEKIEVRDQLKAGLADMEPEQAEQARAVIAEFDREIAEEQEPASPEEKPGDPKEQEETVRPSETSGGLSLLPSSTSTPATSTA